MAALDGNAPLGMFAFDCIARRGVLGDDGIETEVRRVVERAAGAPVAGFYTYGEIARTRRHGIAVFPTREGLYRYLVERGAELEGKAVVEIAGRRSEDLDLDADQGALLVFPERIVEARPLDPEIAEAVRRRLGDTSSAA